MSAPVPEKADLLAGLNPEQRAAVLHTGKPLLVIAGPGSGKTRVIAHRIAYRLQTGLDSRRVVALTFTNRAASELRSRIENLAGETAEIRAGTFHWLCGALLRRHAARIGYGRGFTLLTPREARAVMREALLVPALPPTQLGRLAQAISAHKNGAALADAAVRQGLTVAALQAAAEAYRGALRQRHALDLDDLLVFACELLQTAEDVRRACRRAVHELVVDEYQDTNPVQQRLLTLLRPEHGDLVAVGDEDQAIYAWRQAGTGSSRRFLEAFSDADIITLETTYRSTKLILRAASSLIRHNPDRPEKRLRTVHPAGERPIYYVAQDQQDEADWIAAEAQRLRDRAGIQWHDMAVLYRINAQSRAIEDALVRASIPYRVMDGNRFYDRPEVRTAVAYLRLALDPGDEVAAEYLLARLPGIGERRLSALRLAARTAGLPLSEALTSVGAGLLPRPVAAQVDGLARRIVRVKAVREESTRSVVAAALAAARSDVELTFPPAGVDAGMEDLDELEAVLSQRFRPSVTLRDLVDRLSLQSDAGPQSYGVNLLTLHAAKGLEFTAVFVTGLEEGLLPHRRALEHDGDLAEERRLCYVGMTRARTALRLSSAHTRFLAGHAFAADPSRFIKEMGPANLDLRSSPRARPRPRLASVAAGDRVVHARWREGTVIAVEGAGRDTLVTVDFDENGRQRLQLCHAPLMLISRGTSGVLAG